MPRIVISASRRTDIPAFYMSWFMDCIDRGLFEVTNPYNRRKSTIPATPDNVHSIVFWSKNFGPFLGRNDGATLTRKGYCLFFNFTINSPNKKLEPMMPSLEERLLQLAQLVKAFGPECIQWRFDPICFFKTPAGAEGTNLDSFQTIARRAADLGIRTCVTSFVDLYRKVVLRLKRCAGLKLFDPPMPRKVETITSLANQITPMGMVLKLCCEKQVLNAIPTDVPVTASSCIPSDQLKALYGPDLSLSRDHGQRTKSGCRCGLSKDIGCYTHHPCSHNCLFCYANPAMDMQT
ncbi:MAG: DUF1848 family protein [Desulfobacteraceae bacterium]